MVEPHTLKIGDRVTHPQWPDGSWAEVAGFAPFSRWDARRRRAVADPQVRIVFLDRELPDEDGEPADAWMEAGLIAMQSPSASTQAGA